MKKSALFFIAAAVVAMPAIILIANMTWFAFVGTGFLPAASSTAMANARGAVTFLSIGCAVCLFGVGCNK